MLKMLKRIAGTKSFKLAVAAILTAAGGWYADQITTTELVKVLFGAIAVMFGRDAIAKIGSG